MKLVRYPISDVRCTRISKGTVGCSTHTRSIYMNAPIPASPRINGTRTLYDPQGYVVPAHIRARIAEVDDATKRKFLNIGVSSRK